MTNRLIRVVASLLVLWTSLAVAEFPGIHACAVHSLKAGGHHHSHSSSGGAKKAQCTCPGDECSTPAIVVPTKDFRVAAAITHTEQKTSRVADVQLPRPIELRLLFPIGPPSPSPATARTITA